MFILFKARHGTKSYGRPPKSNPGAETGNFLKNSVNSIAADALAPCVTRASVEMLLTLEYGSLSSKGENFNYLTHLSDKERYKMQAYFNVFSNNPLQTEDVVHT